MKLTKWTSVATVLLFVIIQAWILHLTLAYPFTGIYVEKQGSDYVIARLSEESASQKMGLVPGDTIKEVDGKPPESSVSLRKFGVIEQAETVRFERNGHLQTLDILSFRNSAYTYIFPAVGEAVALAMAAFTFFRLRNSRSAALLTVVFLTIGATFMSLAASTRGDSLGKFIITNSLGLIPLFFLHFLHAFIEDKGGIRLRPLTLRVLYALAGAGIVFRLGYFSAATAPIVYHYSETLSALLFVIGVVLNFATLTYVYIRNRTKNAYLRTVIKMIGASLIVSVLPFIVLSLLPNLFYNKYWASAIFTGWLVLFFPFSFTYLLAADRLYDLHLVARRILLTTAISLVPSMLFIGMLYVMKPDFPVDRAIYLFVFILIVTSLVLYALEYMSTKLEPTFFPQKNRLNRTLKKITADLQIISSFRELKEIVLVDIVDVLQVRGAAVLFCYGDKKETFVHGEVDLESAQSALSDKGTDDPVCTLFEINRTEEYTSYLCISPKKANTMLGKEEKSWLGLIVTYLAVSLENMHLIRKLTIRLEELAAQLPNEKGADELAWFRKLLFELQEKERTRIATDLHDTTMQDLFFLKRRLLELPEKYNLGKETLEQLRSLVGYVEIINTNLRQSCFELHPYLIREIGIVRTLQKMVEQESFHAPFRIEFAAEHTEALEDWDLEKKRHVFRILQELLNNAKKHSGAMLVRIRLSMSEESIVLDYQDDGVGFDPGMKTDREIGSSGIGMEQIHSRVIYLQGRLDLETAMGKGVQIRIHLPAGLEMSA